MKSRTCGGALKSLAVLVGGCFAGSVMGAGFGLNEISAGAMGTANAGRSANPEDASVMASNPAGIAFLDRMQWSAGMAVIFPKGGVENASGCRGGVLNNAGECRTGSGSGGNGSNDLRTGNGDGGSFISPVAVPAAYFAMPIDEKWSAGFGFYVPFAALTEYDDEFAGAYLATKTELTNINLQGTVSYKFSDSLSVGLGLFAAHLDGTLANLKYMFGAEMDTSMEGDDWGYGWNVGLLWMPSEKTRIGLSYTSKVDFTVEGDFEVTGDLKGKAEGHLDVTLPDKVEIAVAHELNDRWTLLAGALWTGWSRFDEINAIADEDLILAPLNITAYKSGEVATHVPENWTDVWSWSIGAEYKYSSQWTLKCGYAHDNSPVRNVWRNARIPDVDREWLTLGAKYQPTDDYIIDMAYGYMLKTDASIDEHGYKTDRSGDRDGVSFKGDYKDMGAHVLMLSLTRLM